MEHSTDQFLYSSYAHSISASVEHPSKAFLSDVPMAVTPLTGGLFSQTRENIVLKAESFELLRVGRASATVQGSRCGAKWVNGEEVGGNHVSIATTTLENLNILDTVTADLVVARSVSVYPANDTNENDSYKGAFHFRGSYFVNLRVNGELKHCQIESDFLRDEGCRIRKTEVRRASLFGDKCGHIPIPHFGTVILGELNFYYSKATLTMIQVEVDCPLPSRFRCCVVTTNGTNP